MKRKIKYETINLVFTPSTNNTTRPFESIKFPEGYNTVVSVQTYEDERAKPVDYDIEIRNNDQGVVQGRVTKQHFLTSNSAGVSDRAIPLDVSGTSTMDVVLTVPAVGSPAESKVTFVFLLEDINEV